MFAWPSIICTERMSAPFWSKSVAKRVADYMGCNFFEMPASVAYLRTRRSMDRDVRRLSPFFVFYY